MLLSVKVVRKQLDFVPKARFEYLAWETVEHQAQDWPLAGPRVPLGCLLETLVINCGLENFLVGVGPLGGACAQGPKQWFAALRAGIGTSTGR